MNFYVRKRRTPTVIIVSLIDIFAILLIFVIVTTTFKRQQPAVVIKLPESSTATPTDQAEALVNLSVTPEGAVLLNGQEVPLEALTGEIKKIVASKQKLALNADKRAPFGVVIRVLDSLKEAGLTGNLPAFTETLKTP